MGLALGNDILQSQMIFPRFIILFGSKANVDAYPLTRSSLLGNLVGYRQGRFTVLTVRFQFREYIHASVYVLKCLKLFNMKGIYAIV
jgi:hypothetical protein